MHPKPVRRTVTRALVCPVLVALLGAGCVTATSPEIASMKDGIETALGGDFEREVGIRLGRVSIGFGKAILGAVGRHADGDDDLSAITDLLRGLRKVEVSVYETGALDDEGWQDVPLRVERAMARGRWTAAVRVRAEHELAWVFCKLDQTDQLRGVTVVTLDGEQLTFVRLAGRLDRALAAAISLARQSAGDDDLDEVVHEAAGAL
jgi:hypothetical protein